MDINELYENQKINYINAVNKYRTDNSFNYRGEQIDNDSVKNHFEIIEVCANHVYDYMSDDNDARFDNIYDKKLKELINNTKIKKDDASYSKIEDNLVENYSNTTYFCTDIHGDLFSLLISLTGNEDNTKNLARFKANEPHILYRDISKDPKDFIDANACFTYRNNEVGSSVIYKDISKFNAESMLNLVPIANLEPNPEFIGTFVYGGDLIDRGSETESCFYTFEYLLILNTMLNTKQNKIIYEIGNHEEEIITGHFKKQIYNNYEIDNGFNCINGIKFSNKQKMVIDDEEFETILDEEEKKEEMIDRLHDKLIIKRKTYMRNAFINLNKNKIFKIMYTENNNIFCHSVIKHALIIETLNAIITVVEVNTLLEEYFSTNSINKEMIEKLKANIIIDKKLETDEIKLLVNIFNTCLQFNFDLLSLPINSAERNEFIRYNNNMLYTEYFYILTFERELSIYELKSINGVNMFVVGHDIQNNRETRFKNQYLFADIGTSEGFCFREGMLKISLANVLEFNSKNNIFIFKNGIDRFYLNYLYNNIAIKIMEQKLNFELTAKELSKITDKSTSFNEITNADLEDLTFNINNMKLPPISESSRAKFSLELENKNITLNKVRDSFEKFENNDNHELNK